MIDSNEVIKNIIRKPVSRAIKETLSFVQIDGGIETRSIIEANKIKSALKTWHIHESHSVDSDLSIAIKTKNSNLLCDCLIKLSFILSKKTHIIDNDNNEIWEFPSSFKKALSMSERRQAFSKVWKILPDAVDQWMTGAEKTTPIILASLKTIKEKFPVSKVVNLAIILDMMLRSGKYKELARVYLPQLIILLMKIKQSGPKSAFGIVSTNQMLSLIGRMATDKSLYLQNESFFKKYTNVERSDRTDHALPDKKTIIDLIRQGLFSCRLIIKSLKDTYSVDVGYPSDDIRTVAIGIYNFTLSAGLLSHEEVSAIREIYKYVDENKNFTLETIEKVEESIAKADILLINSIHNPALINAVGIHDDMEAISQVVEEAHKHVRASAKKISYLWQIDAPPEEYYQYLQLLVSTTKKLEFIQYKKVTGHLSKACNLLHEDLIINQDETPLRLVMLLLVSVEKNLESALSGLVDDKFLQYSDQLFDGNIFNEKLSIDDSHYQKKEDNSDYEAQEMHNIAAAIEAHGNALCDESAEAYKHASEILINLNDVIASREGSQALSQEISKSIALSNKLHVASFNSQIIQNDACRLSSFFSYLVKEIPQIIAHGKPTTNFEYKEPEVSFIPDKKLISIFREDAIKNTQRIISLLENPDRESARGLISKSFHTLAGATGALENDNHQPLIDVFRKLELAYEYTENSAPSSSRVIEFCLSLLEYLSHDVIADTAYLVNKYNIDQAEESDGHQYDDNLLEYFIEEAEGIVPKIHALIEYLSNCSDDKNKLIVSLKRNFHTLKASSLSCGANYIGMVSGATEDILEFVEDDYISIDNSLINLLSNVEKEIKYGLFSAKRRVDYEGDQNLLDSIAESIKKNEIIFLEKDQEIPSASATKADSPKKEEKKELRVTDKYRFEPEVKNGSEKGLASPLKVSIKQVDQLVDSINRSASNIDMLDLEAKSLSLSMSAISRKTSSIAHNDEISHELAELSDKFNCMVEKISAASSIQRMLRKGGYSLRLTVASSLSGRLHSIVAQTSKKLGKKVDLKIVGDSIEVDKGVLDVISEPIIHILNNAIDHGIENKEQRNHRSKKTTGLISITYKISGKRVQIAIKDDGAGLDRDRIMEKGISRKLISENETYRDTEVFDLITHPGFSTATKVSSISGRGMGMDIVKNTIETLGGRLSIDSDLGEHTTFTLDIPVDVHMSKMIIAKVSDLHIAIPTHTFNNMKVISRKDIDAGVISYDGIQYSIETISGLLNKNITPQESYDALFMIDKNVCIAIDGASSCEDLFINPSPKLLSESSYISGYISTHRFSPCYVIDPLNLYNYAKMNKHHEQAVPIVRKKTILIIDDSIFVRRQLSSYLSNDNYTLLLAADGEVGLSMFENNKVHLVIVDEEMPGISGLSVSASIRKKHGDTVPIIMSTSHENIEEEAINAGINEFITKPINQGEFIEIIDELVGGTVHA